MSNLKIGPVDITSGTAKFDIGGLQVGVSQFVANGDGSVTLIGGSHVLTSNSNSIVAGNQDAGMVISSNVGYYKHLSFRAGASERWRVLSSGGAEGEGNNGSNFYISRYTNAGAFIDSPLLIDRATGSVTISNALLVPSLSVAANDLRAANTNFVKTCFDNVADRPEGDSTTSAANTRFVTTALASITGTKVSTFNGRSGAVTLTSADIVNALGYTPANPTNVVTGIRGVDPGGAPVSTIKTGVVDLAWTNPNAAGIIDPGGSRLNLNFAPYGEGSFCIHPQSLISMNDGTKKFAQDVRPGDVLQNSNKVLGLLNSVLYDRTWIEINNKAVVTSDHLIKVSTGWSVKSKEQYTENYKNKIFACKTLSGMKNVSGDFGDAEDFAFLGEGLVLSTGETITSMKEFPGAPSHPVIALYTEQDSFFADDIEVSSMGREVAEV